MVLQVKGCCGCCSLKSGTVVIGAQGILTGIFMILAALAEPGRPKSDSQELATILENFSHTNSEHDAAFAIVMKIVMAFVEIIMSIVLIWGATKGRPKFVYSWIVLNVVQNSLALIVLSTLAIYLVVTGLVEVGMLLMVALLFVSSIQGYMILVVNSFHTTMLSPPSYEYSNTKDPTLFA